MNVEIEKTYVLKLTENETNLMLGILQNAKTEDETTNSKIENMFYSLRDIIKY